MKKPIFSIIIPHKNCPKLLQRCLDTIPRCEEIEVIVVDDSSDIGIIDRDTFPKGQYSNVNVILTKEGKGAGYARNIGVQCARGRWLLFADADDYFTNDFFSVISEYRDSNYDIIFFSATSIYPETGELAIRHRKIQHSIECAVKGDYSLVRYERASPIAKIIKSSLVKKYDIKFDEVIASNDAYFSLQTGFWADKIYADPREIYVITVRKGSLEYTWSEQILLSRIFVDYRLNAFLRKNHINKRIRVLKHIIPLFKISKRVFIKEFFRYLIKDPVLAISDILYYGYRIFVKIIIASKDSARNRGQIRIEKK